jgi:predicted nucleotidyltransferase component of viral defense system
MNKWLAIADETKRNAYIQVAEKSGMSAFTVEKDWWVVQTLSVIFGMEVGQHLVFKGGTSLSKAWKLIERFSEDIDLAIDRDFFGYDGSFYLTCSKKYRKPTSSISM